VEIGPAVNIYIRRASWSFAAYGRVGGQKEAREDWKPLGVFRLTVERELWKAYAMSAAFTHSTSNIASSTGFSRTSFTINATRRF
jgi:hypothetical protein